MTDAYLLLVSAAGVERLAEETPSARGFLTRRCERSPRPLACYWAYLSPENAQLIRWLIACGQTRPALWLLNEAALDAGPVTPERIGSSEVTPSYFAS